MDTLPTAPTLAIFETALEHVVKHGHESVHGGHLLLGVLALESGTAFSALDRIGVDRTAVRAGLDAVLPANKERERDGEYPYDASGVAVINSVMAEAASGGNERLTSALVLLGILAAEGAELRVLREAGVSIPELAAELRSRVSDPE